MRGFDFGTTDEQLMGHMSTAGLVVQGCRRAHEATAGSRCLLTVGEVTPVDSDQGMSGHEMARMLGAGESACFVLGQEKSQTCIGSPEARRW